MVVQLDATHPGSYAGQISLSTSDPAHPTAAFSINGTVTPPAPVLTVLDNQTTLASGSGSDSLGTTPVGAAVRKTLTLENTGSGPLLLNVQSLVLPAGYSVVTSFAANVAAGDSTTLVFQLD